MDRRDRALTLFERAYEQQMHGDLDRAIALYKESIEVLPTAEAYTFLAWTYSFQGRYRDAILECRKAIDADPDFGNAYNDLGAYLIEDGRPEEAIPWLRRALAAKRYEAYHYPHYNLGRALEARGRWSEALSEYREALRIEPDFEEAARCLTKLQARMN